MEIFDHLWLGFSVAVSPMNLLYALIGTLLGTGTVVGVGASVHGGGPTPRWVPPFAWGSSGLVMTEDGFLSMAERMMARRDVPLTDARRASLRAAYARAVEPVR